jgi:hypothetical protein
MFGRPLHRIARSVDLDVGRINTADALAAILDAFNARHTLRRTALSD